MVKFDDIIGEIRETKKEIKGTKSKNRKYQLQRRLNKLLKEYKVAKMYYAEYRKGL